MEPIAIASLCLKIQTHSMFIFRVGWNHQPDLVGEYIEKKSSVVSPTAATIIVYKSFWSVLRSQALKTPGNLTWLYTKASQTFSGTFGTFSGTSLNLNRRLHQCTPELFLAEDPISLRCWEKNYKCCLANNDTLSIVETCFPNSSFISNTKSQLA